MQPPFPDAAPVPSHQRPPARLFVKMSLLPGQKATGAPDDGSHVQTLSPLGHSVCVPSVSQAIIQTSLRLSLQTLPQPLEVAWKQIPPFLVPYRPGRPGTPFVNPLKSALRPLAQIIPSCVHSACLDGSRLRRSHEPLGMWSESAESSCVPEPGASPRHTLGALLPAGACMEPDSKGRLCVPQEVIVLDPAPKSRPAQPTGSPEGQAASDTGPECGFSPWHLETPGRWQPEQLPHQQGPHLL